MPRICDQSGNTKGSTETKSLADESKIPWVGFHQPTPKDKCLSYAQHLSKKPIFILVDRRDSIVDFFGLQEMVSINICVHELFCFFDF